MNTAGTFRKIISMGAIGALLFSAAAGFFPESAYAAQGEVITHYKTGIETKYKILSDGAGGTIGTVQLGNGSGAAVPLDTQGTVFIPEDVTSYDAWETVRSFRVTKIGAKAFSGCTQIDKLHIEGRLTIDGGALDGLASDVIFETGSLETKEALLAYGIPANRVLHKPAHIKYVAFGDSIAAGYALPSYVKDDLTADKFPTPPEAFVSLVGNELNKRCGLAITDNQAVSGWTSKQLLDQLQRGDYDAALENADVITVTIGSNDLLGPFMGIVEEAINKEFGADDSRGNERRGDLTGAPKRPIKVVDKFVEKLSRVIDALNTDLADNATLNAACQEFQQTIQPGILKKLHEKAPDAEIYWTTLYNPFYGEELDIKQLVPGLENTVSAETWAGLSSIDLSGYGAVYIEKMNQAFEKNTEGYHAIDLYGAFNQEDLTNVEITREDNGTPDDATDDTVNLNFDPHPNVTGHRLIADLAIPVITKTCPPEKPTDGTTGDDPAAESVSRAGGTVDTGDDSSIKLPLILLAVSSLAMAILAIQAKRKLHR